MSHKKGLEEAHKKGLDDADFPVTSRRFKKPQKPKQSKDTQLVRDKPKETMKQAKKSGQPENIESKKLLMIKNPAVALQENSYNPVDIILSCMADLIGKYPKKHFKEENIRQLDGSPSKDDIQLAKFLGFSGCYFLSRPLTNFTYFTVEKEWKLFCKDVKEKDMIKKLPTVKPWLESFSTYIHSYESRNIKNEWVDLILNGLDEERVGCPALEKRISKLYEYAGMTQIKTISDMIAAKNCSAILLETVAAQANAFLMYEADVKKKLKEKYKYAGLLRAPELSVLQGSNFPDLLHASLTWAKENHKLGKSYVVKECTTFGDKKKIEKMAKKKH